jgi:hypothetical protein
MQKKKRGYQRKSEGIPFFNIFND